MAYRYDIGALRPPKVRADGSIRVDGYLTRSGVFQYSQGGKIVNEYRPPSEVFRADSLESLQMVPVTDDHPPERAITADNARALAVGSVGEVITVEDNKVRAALAITDAKTIEKIRAGKVQISCGYHCDRIEESGVTPEGEKYDSIQRNIVYNHVALVRVGRAGPEVRIRTDEADIAVQVAQSTEVSDTFEQQQEIIMDELKKALAEALAANTRADAAEKSVKELSEKLAKTEGERDAQTARADAAEKVRTDAAANFPAAVAARVSLEKQVQAVTKVDCAGLSDRDLKVKALAELGITVDSAQSDAYVDGAFAVQIQNATKSAEALANTRVAAADAKVSSGLSLEAEARQKMINDQQNAWKGKE